MSDNQIYPQYNQQKNFILPVGVPLSAAPTTEKAPKFPFQVQIPGMVFTGFIGLIYLFMAINYVSIAIIDLLDNPFDSTCIDFILFAYCSLFFYFAVMAIAFPNHLADEKPKISKIWPIATANFMRLFLLFECAEIKFEQVVMVLLGRLFIMACFYFCYFSGKDGWPLGNIFKPWNKINYEAVENPEQV